MVDDHDDSDDEIIRLLLLPLCCCLLGFCCAQDAPKSPLVVELHPTSWKVRTSCTERQIHGHGQGHKKMANLQYCIGSRQVLISPF